MVFDESVSVATTHSTEAVVSAAVNSAPFDAGVTFKSTSDYGFSATNKDFVTPRYVFELKKNTSGYVVMANVQISTQVRFRACECTDLFDDPENRVCTTECEQGEFAVDQVGHHESVVTKGNGPRGIVAFIYNTSM